MISPILSLILFIFACVYDDLSSHFDFLLSVQIGRTLTKYICNRIINKAQRMKWKISILKKNDIG